MVIYGEILVEIEKTSANSDVLSGTELDTAPSDGWIYLWCASTVNTATVEVAQPNHQAGKTNLMRKRTDGIPLLDQDPCFVIPVKKSQRPAVVLAGTTGTCHFTAIFKR